MAPKLYSGQSLITTKLLSKGSSLPNMDLRKVLIHDRRQPYTLVEVIKPNLVGDIQLRRSNLPVSPRQLFRAYGVPDVYVLGWTRIGFVYNPSETMETLNTAKQYLPSARIIAWQPHQYEGMFKSGGVGNFVEYNNSSLDPLTEAINKAINDLR